MEWIGTDGRAATGIAAGGTPGMQPLQVYALAFPIADGVIDELKLAQTPEVGDGKHRIEDTLQPGIFPLSGQQVHLQKSLIRFLLNLDQIWDGDRGLDSREINSFARCSSCQIFHFR